MPGELLIAYVESRLDLGRQTHSRDHVVFRNRETRSKQSVRDLKNLNYSIFILAVIIFPAFLGNNAVLDSLQLHVHVHVQLS